MLHSSSPAAASPEGALGVLLHGLGEEATVELVRRLADTLPVALVLLSPAGRLLAANAPARALMPGAVDDSVAGAIWFELLEPDAPRRALRETMQLVLTESSSAPVDCVCNQLNVHGDERRVEWRLARLETHEKDARMVVASGHDRTEERRIAEAARQTTDRLRALTEACTDGIFLESLDGRVLECNSAAALMHGYGPDEVIGLHVSDLVPEEVAASLPNITDTHRSAQGVFIEARARRKDGSTFPTLVSTRVVELDGEPRCVAFVRDESVRREAERARERYARRLEGLRALESSVQAAHSAVEVARAALEHLGRLIPCTRASVVLFAFEMQRAHVLAVVPEGEGRLAPGQTLPLETFGHSLSGSHRAVQRRIPDEVPELTLSPLQRVLRAEGIRSYLTVSLLAGGRLIGSLNLGSSRRDGFTSEELEVAEESAGPTALAIRQAQLREKVERHAEELERRVEERTELLAERVAEAERLNLALRDVLAEVRETNQRLEETSNQLREANSELQAFTRTVSHDLGAPLRAMRGFSEALLEDWSDALGAEGRDLTRRIHEASGRMQALVQDLLDYARVGRSVPQLSAVALDGAVAEAVEALSDERDRQSAQISVQPELPTVLAHPALLGRIIENLLSNAMKFVPEGVRPSVRIEAETLDDRVRLWIEDNGIGVASSDSERVFEVFHRLSRARAYPGTGMGLAIARKSAQRMGGHVGVEPRPFGGSRFWVELKGAP